MEPRPAAQRNQDEDARKGADGGGQQFRRDFANYYLSLLDRLEKLPDENPSIGIILCAEKDHVQVELALEDMGKPIGVADYQLIIPKEELQKAISDEIRTFNNEHSDKD